MQPFWTAQLQAFSGYDACAVRACIVELHALHRKAAYSNLRAVFDEQHAAARSRENRLKDRDAALTAVVEGVHQCFFLIPS